MVEFKKHSPNSFSYRSLINVLLIALAIGVLSTFLRATFRERATFHERATLVTVFRPGHAITVFRPGHAVTVFRPGQYAFVRCGPLFRPLFRHAVTVFRPGQAARAGGPTAAVLQPPMPAFCGVTATDAFILLCYGH